MPREQGTAPPVRAARDDPWRAADPRPPEPPVAVLLHGLGMNGASWGPVVASFDPRWETLAPDLPWGIIDDRSGRPLLDAPEILLARVLDRMPRPPSLVVAHSFAAAALLQLVSGRSASAPTCPLVLVAPLLPQPGRADGEAVLERFRHVIREGVKVRLGRRTTRIPSSLVDLMVAKILDAVPPDVPAACAAAAQRLAQAPLERVLAPVLLLGGAADPAAPLQSVQALADRLPRGVASTPIGAGHFCHLENPQRLIEAIGTAALH
ncbi:MAG TPA: alpha/beta hydrolase [Kineosporiaceae bacterium]|nr:alpha/beta hydrolase [Kineosporiaceae bacterium]